MERERARERRAADKQREELLRDTYRGGGGRRMQNADQPSSSSAAASSFLVRGRGTHTAHTRTHSAGVAESRRFATRPEAASGEHEHASVRSQYKSRGVSSFGPCVINVICGRANQNQSHCDPLGKE